MSRIDEIMRTAPVIPVLVVEDVAMARPLAEALVKGGLTVLEVTLRTDAALDVIREMKQVEGAIVGAGTVTNPQELEQAIEAGSEFIVSPGLTETLGRAAVDSGIPFLPGTANAGDIMRGLDLGLDRFKFFPATAAGGIPALKSLAAPFHKVRFCPTGGITEDTASDWLAMDSVLCCGGSWLVPKGSPDYVAIAEGARRAAALAA
ncbi:bifunctional 4-hydroxy-2-oxoglutarate aldolase/2-dehydro-3-deoxy-phosphogluconate aldolase [Paraurantiacibacter namhicola]|uniref:2-dehydro-3-deoxy-phosphogluconate aldolase n=1 Tax=Paraurantiacibacter namhicola TaxID=645517 RepID=A0A1C7DB51_9SPHN|nr:bifunctional 4-hydroxy-2-oxoglutarate aldolase/2-dehydro-3-deoxy-phosphogluconate aldolase [Paraurantiacibacter namhicola]ANU08730.1 KHG/KDPG aldolase [Paraurantiacibacter namhicola]